MYMALSEDGFVAEADGGVAFLDEFQEIDYGYADFITEVSLITMGRKSYDQILGFGSWPYWEKDVLVHTSHPIVDPPQRCTPWQENPKALVTAWQEHQTHSPGDLWVLGGPQLCRAYLEEDLIDRMDLFVMPIRLAKGLPLFHSDNEKRTLQLDQQQSFENGVVQKTYQRPRPRSRSPRGDRQKASEPAPLPQKQDSER